MHAFVHSPSPLPYFALGTVLDAGDGALKETDEASVLMQCEFPI